MKTNNYKDKSPEELNKLLATRICGWHEDIDRAVKYAPELKWWVDDKLMTDIHTGIVMLQSDWNPCDPNSAQIQNYVIPVLLKHSNDIQIAIYFWEGDYTINIVRHDSKNFFDIKQKTDDITQLNQVVAAAFLEAFEIIEGEKK